MPLPLPLLRSLPPTAASLSLMRERLNVLSSVSPPPWVAFAPSGVSTGGVAGFNEKLGLEKFPRWRLLDGVTSSSGARSAWPAAVPLLLDADEEEEDEEEEDEEEEDDVVAKGESVVTAAVAAARAAAVAALMAMDEEDEDDEDDEDNEDEDDEDESEEEDVVRARARESVETLARPDGVRGVLAGLLLRRMGLKMRRRRRVAGEAGASGCPAGADSARCRFLEERPPVRSTAGVLSEPRRALSARRFHRSWSRHSRASSVDNFRQSWTMALTSAILLRGQTSRKTSWRRVVKMAGCMMSLPARWYTREAMVDDSQARIERFTWPRRARPEAARTERPWSLPLHAKKKRSQIRTTTHGSRTLKKSGMNQAGRRNVYSIPSSSILLCMTGRLCSTIASKICEKQSRPRMLSLKNPAR